MVIICLFATDIIHLIVGHIYWLINLYFPSSVFCRPYLSCEGGSQCCPHEGKDLDAALRLIFLPYEQCADLGCAGLYMACRKGSCSCARVPILGPNAAWLCGTDCTWGTGFAKGKLLWGTLGPSIFFPKVLNKVNPELIWASTTSGEESAMSCKTQNWVLFRLAARLGQQGFAGCVSLLADAGGCLLASIPPPQLLVAPEGDAPAMPPHPPVALGWLQPLGLPAKVRHFLSISTDLGLIWVASVYRLYPLLNNASVTAVLSSFHHDVNVFNQGALDTY